MAEDKKTENNTGTSVTPVKTEKKPKEKKVKTKKKSSGKADKALSGLIKVNDALEKVPENALKFFNMLQVVAQEASQGYVDLICKWVARGINVRVESIRQGLIKGLYNQYKGALALVGTASIVQNVLSDPIGSIGDFIGIWVKPVSVIVNYIVELVAELARLAENLAKIASMTPPQPLNPKINYDAFQIQVNMISLGDVIAGPDALPPPEEVFPEVTNPFSVEAFKKNFEGARAETKDEKLYYHLPSKKKKEAEASSGETFDSDFIDSYVNGDDLI